jgi:hypothetical protein
VSRSTARTAPVREDWAAELRHDFPGWFDVNFGCHGGWSDLTRAMAEWLWELGMPKGFHFLQIKEKFGGLRAYASVRTLTTEQMHIVRERIDACEAASYGICEKCGEPGHPRRKDGIYQTSCDQHV